MNDLAKGRQSFVWFVAVAALALPFAVPVGTADAAEPATSEWISVDSGEIGGRELPAVSADGRYVVFVGRSSENMGVWIRDRATDTTTRLTSGSHFNPAISADGRTVAYAQYGGGGQGVYALEWQDDGASPELVSVSDSGGAPGVPTDFPAVSEDGRYVAFQSYTDDLDDDALPGKTGGGPSKVYVRDRVAGDTEMVSVTNAGEIANGNANRPDITPDGRYVVFSSDATELAGTTPPEEPLAPEDEDEEAAVVHVYRHDRDTGETLMVSVASDGTAGDGNSATAYGPTISDDGTKVAFESDSTNLVGDDTNGNTDAFVRDVAAESTIRVSLDEHGAQVTLVNPQEMGAPTTPPTDPSAPPVDSTTSPDDAVMAPPEEGESIDLLSNAGAGPAISGDGRLVAFESDGALTADDLNTPDPVDTYEVTTAEGTYVVPVYTTDVYTRSLSDDALVRSSAATGDGVEATGLRTDGLGSTAPANNGADPAISEDGRLVAFVSNGNLSGERPPSEEEGDLAAEEDEALWEPAVWASYDLGLVQSLRFMSIDPCAVFDTRFGTGAFDGPLDGGDVVTFTVASDSALPIAQGGAGCAGVPADAVAVELNLVAARPHGTGNLRVSPAGTVPQGGVVNFTNGFDNSSSVVVPVDDQGRIDVGVNGLVPNLVDVRGVAVGYYVEPDVEPDSLLFVDQTACAVFDTRAAGGALAGGETRTFAVAGTFDQAAQGGEGCTAPPEGAVAALVNLVAMYPEAAGNLRAVAAGGDALGGVVNFRPDSGNNSNAVPIGLSMDGEIDVTANTPAPVHVRGVVLGYYVDSSHDDAADGLELVPMTACAAFDTREEIGRLDGGDVLTTTVATDGLVPAVQGAADCMPAPAGAVAVALNLVSIQPATSGNLKLAASGVTAQGGVVNFHPARGNNSNAVVVGHTAGEVDTTVNAVVPDVVHVRGVTLGWYIAP